MKKLKKIKFLVQCVFRMNLSRLFKTANRIANENRRFSVVIFFDMLWCGVRYGAGYVDYQIFDFVRLSSKQRKTFVTRGINNEFIRKLNTRESYYRFEDKTVFNELFSEFVGRKWWSLPAGEVLEVDGDFDVIVKPVDSICGQGIEKVKVSEIKQADYARIVEEYIIQHDEVSRLHPESVNTIRFMTVVDKQKEVHVMFRALRVGSGGNVVDNFNAGGMFVLLDENGVICSDAINKNTDVFEAHPTTGVRFKGCQIPYFQEAEEMVKSAALLGARCGIGYVSWDVAITPSRPVLVEGNHNPGYDLLQSKVYLMSNEYGRLPDFRKVV
jgi:glutathione synthase/RimK-type ligase-like ATP-grasp enzyme